MFVVPQEVGAVLVIHEENKSASGIYLAFRRSAFLRAPIFTLAHRDILRVTESSRCMKMYFSAATILFESTNSSTPNIYFQS